MSIKWLLNLLYVLCQADCVLSPSCDSSYDLKFFLIHFVDKRSFYKLLGALNPTVNISVST
jgi:hypothetical protein